MILVRSQRKYATCYTLSLRPSRPHCTFATCTWAILRPHQSLSNFRQLSVHHNKNEFKSHLPTIMMALPLRVLKYKSAMQSESRSLRAQYDRHELPAAPNLDACFKQVQNKRRGLALWRESTVDRAARRELLERIENFLSVLRTNQKRMEATLGPRNFPLDRNVKQLYAHCALNTSLYPFHCGIIALPLPRDRNVQQL